MGERGAWKDYVATFHAVSASPRTCSTTPSTRVLRPGGTFAATVPSNRPMPAADWLRYARLCLALRHPSLSYPNDSALGDAERIFRQARI